MNHNNYNNMNTNNYPGYGVNPNVNYNVSSSSTQPHYNPNYPMNSNYNQPPTYGTIDQQKGYAKTNKDGDMKIKDTNIQVDPLTGDKVKTVTKTKVERNRSRSSSSSSGRGGEAKKMKTKYNTEVKNTPLGVETRVQEKHREGGMMQNIKNKINKVIHHWSQYILFTFLHSINIKIDY